MAVDAPANSDATITQRPHNKPFNQQGGCIFPVQPLEWHTGLVKPQNAGIHLHIRNLSLICMLVATAHQTGVDNEYIGLSLILILSQNT